MPAAADPVNVAALAYLIRPPAWPERVEPARRDLERSALAADAAETNRKLAELQAQPLADRFGQLGALVKGQRAQGGAAYLAAVGERGTEVDAFGGDLRDRLPGDRVVDRGAAVGREPAACDVAADYCHERPSVPLPGLKLYIPIIR